jgi:hypothetical protein
MILDCKNAKYHFVALQDNFNINLVFEMKFATKVKLSIYYIEVHCIVRQFRIIQKMHNYEKQL